MQRVRLDTAPRTHLLSDPATVDDGLSVLEHAAEVAVRHGMKHQLRSIEAVRDTVQEAKRLRLRRPGRHQ
jgi:hypothetical protein